MTVKEMEEKIKRLEDENRALRNRCAAATQGLCAYCDYDCENRHTEFRGEKDD